MEAVNFDAMLDDMFPNQQTDCPIELTEEVVVTVEEEKEPTCPRCDEILEYGEIEQDDGEI